MNGLLARIAEDVRPEIAARAGMSGTGTEEIVVPDTVEELLGGEDVRPDVPWVVLVWNDPINTMDYVTLRVPEALRLLARQGAASHAAGAQRGQGGRVDRAIARSARSTSPGCTRHGLWATMQKDD